MPNHVDAGDSAHGVGYSALCVRCTGLILYLGEDLTDIQGTVSLLVLVSFGYNKEKINHPVHFYINEEFIPVSMDIEMSDCSIFWGFFECPYKFTVSRGLIQFREPDPPHEYQLQLAAVQIIPLSY